MKIIFFSIIFVLSVISSSVGFADDVEKKELIKKQSQNLLKILDAGKYFSNSDDLRDLVASMERVAVGSAQEDMGYSIKLVKSFCKAFDKQLADGGIYSYYENSTGGVSSAYELLLGDVITKLGKMVNGDQLVLDFISRVESDEYLSARTEWCHYAYIKTYRSMIDMMMGIGRSFGGARGIEDQMLNKVAERWKDAEPKMKGVIRFAILNKYLYQPRNLSRVSDEVVESWKNKAEGSDIHQTLYLAALMHREDSVEARIESSIAIVVEHLKDKNIPVSYRLSFAAHYLKRFHKAVGYPEFLDALVDTGSEYFKGQRNVKTLRFRDLFDSLTKALEVMPEHNQRVLPLFQSWEKKVRIPAHIGEQDKLFCSLAECSILLAAQLGQSDVMKQLYESHKKNVFFGLSDVVTLMNTGEYEMVQMIMARMEVANHGVMKGEGYHRDGYDKLLENRVVEFKGVNKDPVTAFRFEYLLLRSPDSDENKPIEDHYERRLRLLNEYVKLKPRLDEKFKFEALHNLTLSPNDEDKWSPLLRELLAKADLYQIFEDYIEYDAKDTVKSTDYYFEIKMELCIIDAVHGLNKGDYNRLDDILNEFEEFTDEQNSAPGIAELREILYKHLAYPFFKILQSGKKYEIEQLSEFVRRLSNIIWSSTWDKNVFNTHSCLMPMVYASLVSHELGQQEQLKAWGEHLDGRGKGKFRHYMMNSDILFLLSGMFKEDRYWLHAKNKERRMKIMRWLLNNDEATRNTINNKMKYYKTIFKYALTNNDVEYLLKEKWKHPIIESTLLLYKNQMK